MTSTVDGLVREGLVERQTDPTDGRAVVVSLTGRGRRQYERGVEVRDGVLAEVFDVLDDRERDQLASVLRRLGTAARRWPPASRPRSGPGAGGAPTSPAARSRPPVGAEGVPQTRRQNARATASRAVSAG